MYISESKSQWRDFSIFSLHLCSIVLFLLSFPEKHLHKACDFATLITPFISMHVVGLELVSTGDSEMLQTSPCNLLHWTQSKR
jgi:hypothetical protein